jgi:hypothetical protein
MGYWNWLDWDWWLMWKTSERPAWVTVFAMVGLDSEWMTSASAWHKLANTFACCGWGGITMLGKVGLDFFLLVWTCVQRGTLGLDWRCSSSAEFKSSFQNRHNLKDKKIRRVLGIGWPLACHHGLPKILNFCPPTSGLVPILKLTWASTKGTVPALHAVSCLSLQHSWVQPIEKWGILYLSCTYGICV